MLQLIVILSLIITGIHIAFLQGNVLGFVRISVANYLDRYIGMKWSRYVQKPIWDCLPCMASVWTIILTCHFDIWLMVGVCGMNGIIETLIRQHE